MGLSYKLSLAKLPYPPYSITIEATNRCNYKCAFCPQSYPKHSLARAQGDLTIEGFKEFIKQVKQLNSGNNKISICLDGEPLLNKNFPEFIRITNDENIIPRFSTNGRYLSRELIDILNDFGKFIVSIDFASEKEYFEGTRGREGDYEIISSNIKYLLEIARYNKDISIELTDISHFSGADAKKSLHEMRSHFNLTNLTKNIRLYTRNFHNFGGHLGVIDKNSKKKYTVCPYPWYQFAVSWNGDVVICCRDTSGKMVLGNIFSKTITEIWNDEPLKNIRKLLIDQKTNNLEPCNNCDLPFNYNKNRWETKHLLNKLMSQ